MVRQLDVVGLFLDTAMVPFIKTERRDDTAAVLDGMAESGLFSHSLGTGIYQVTTETQVFRPARH